MAQRANERRGRDERDRLLAEFYDADPGAPAARLSEVSARAFAGAGAQVFTRRVRHRGHELRNNPGSRHRSTPWLNLISPAAWPNRAAHRLRPRGQSDRRQRGLEQHAPAAGSSPVPAGIQPATPAVMSGVHAFLFAGRLLRLRHGPDASARNLHGPDRWPRRRHGNCPIGALRCAVDSACRA